MEPVSKDRPGFDPGVFRSKHLDGDPKKSKQDKVQVTLNPEERKILEELKELIGCPFDSRVLKMGLRPLKNILLSQLGARSVRYLCDERRRRKA